MCVAVTLEPGTELTPDEIAKMSRTNSDGAGIAWAMNDWVHWYKTLAVDPEKLALLLNRYVDYPRLAHFRQATVGGIKVELCHPFEISPLARCTKVGRGKQVMIHNGHWNSWHMAFKMLKSTGLLPDPGPWSDTRIAAFLAYSDPDWFTELGGKIAVLDSDENMKWMGNWEKLRDGVQVSNKFWDYMRYANGAIVHGTYEHHRTWDSHNQNYTEKTYPGYKPTLPETTSPKKAETPVPDIAPEEKRHKLSKKERRDLAKMKIRNKAAVNRIAELEHMRQMQENSEKEVEIEVITTEDLYAKYMNDMND